MFQESSDSAAVKMEPSNIALYSDIPTPTPTPAPLFPPIDTTQQSHLSIQVKSLMKSVLVLGSDHIATQAANLLLQAGMIVTVVSGAEKLPTLELQTRWRQGELGLLERDWSPLDWSGKAMVVVADLELGSAPIAAQALLFRVPIYFVGRSELSDFVIESLEALHRCQHRCAGASSPCSVASVPGSLPERTPSEPPLASIPSTDPHPPAAFPLQQQSGPHVRVSDHVQPVRGTLVLVGAGPGGVEHLTQAAVDALKTADLVISDRLVSKETLRLITCELIFARKVHGRAREAQDEIYLWGLKALQEGKRVVRLKGGDPFLFGRGGEEVLFFREHGFETQVVPGLTSALCAPLAAMIPVTHRGTADQLLVATGRREDGSAPDYPPFTEGRTCVFLMAMACITRLVKELDAKGYPRNLPAAIIERATYEDQRVFVGTLESMPQVVADHAIKTHATLVVGRVVYSLRGSENSAAVVHE
ncbi:tetrapyrrole methylase [Polychytrium aggregatum]|uniref:tetrapyrrole methylase n=1 Tax=Polychytrium aggregatum TaxID=110093 RepID=UPI0022FDB7D4|nr:tetrapyrrole methylase [Polychytrium aggregatum]KAI9203504.1 tetrapyrrole methylase [Polychytrium aggregatum]